jgi:mono/diheme cytochrome c family protein
MKKITGTIIAVILIAIAGSFTLTSFTFVRQKQSPSVNTAIPEKVMSIFKVSCVSCHADKGNTMAMGAVNFSQWDTYSAKKQFKKAAAICREVTNGTMPPSSYLAKNPGAKLNVEKTATICNWATSMPPVQ